MKLTFLGTGAGCGVPSFFCRCTACQEASAEPAFARSRSGLLVSGRANTLIDAPPELRHQLVRERVERIGTLILTHSHYDHTGGLGDLEFYVRMGRREAIPAYMTATTRGWLHGAYGFLEDCLAIQCLEYGYTVALDGVAYSALEVTHAEGTFGLLLETPEGRRIAYIPDTGPLPEATFSRVQGIDTLILGATFWGRNWMPEDHLSVQEAVVLGKELGVRALYLTHLSMHYDTPVTSRELEDFLKTDGGEQVHLAYDGLCIEI